MKVESWDQLVEASREAFDSSFDADERDYKVEIANAVREVIAMAARSDDWFGEFTGLQGRKFAGAGYNLTNWRQLDWLKQWNVASTEELRGAVAAFGSDEPPEERFDVFAQAASRAVARSDMPNAPANVIAFGSLFNFAVAPADLPLIRTRAFERLERLVDFRSLSELSLTERYVAHLDFAREARRRFEAAGIEIRDMLDVQGLLWRQWLAENREEEEPPKPEVEGGMGAQRVWWVCQGHTYGVSRDGGYLWAPRVDKAGQPKAHWDRLAEAETGDLILHYSNGSIRAVGTVVAEAVGSDRPSEFAGSEPWKTEGLRLPVAYRELPMPIALSAIPAEWRTPEAGPFTVLGGVQQGYFFPLSEAFVRQVALRFPELELGDLGRAPDISGGDSTAYREPPFDVIRAAIAERGLRIDAQTLRRYHLSLRTRGFVVLSGLSGSGKTWLAELYAEVVGARALLVAVAPNWTTNEDLLGYLDPLSSKYRHTPFSQFLLEAADEYTRAAAEERAARPFHLILDEMNLARVEYYFARFLSAMEVRARAGTTTLELAVDHEALLTPNLKFIGTVNVDETTHGFADKVYDRAQLIEIGVDEAAIREHLGSVPHAADLLAVWKTVFPVAPFAFRVIDEISSYIRESEQIGTAASALDEQLLQKVLPKIKGTDLRCQAALAGLAELDPARFPLTQAKASSMLDGFRAHGFASFF